MTTNATTDRAAIRPPDRTRARTWLIPAVVTFAAVLGGVFLCHRGHPASRAESAEHDAPGSTAPEGIHVDVVRPEPGGLTRTSSQTGSVHPFEQADLYAKVSGYLKRQTVDIGSRV